MSTAAFAAAMRERVQLCKMLAKEMPQWRRFYVDTHGNVHFLEALQLSKPKGQPHKQAAEQCRPYLQSGSARSVISSPPSRHSTSRMPPELRSGSAYEPFACVLSDRTELRSRLECRTLFRGTSCNPLSEGG